MPRISRPRITKAMRNAVASGLGGQPGVVVESACHWCCAPVHIDWTGTRARFVDANGLSTPELDHVVPLARGGDHAISNLVPSCLMCNRRKSAWLVEELAPAIEVPEAEPKHGHGTCQEVANAD